MPFKKRIRKKTSRIKVPDRKRELRESAKGKKELERLKNRDKNANWGYFDTSLSEVEKRLNFNIRSFLKKLIKKKKASVLDLGCGNGQAGAEIKKLFGERVRVVGNFLERPRTKKFDNNYALFDSLVMGDFNDASFKESFDLIYSNFGAKHSLTILHTLQKSIELLRPGGVFVANINLLKRPYFVEEVKELMSQNGINHKHYSFSLIEDGLRIVKPVRKLN
jgi:SAM-dependent methyltransferase